LPKAPKGCWLDTLKVQAAAKRKAAILAVSANKRAAQGQGLKPAAAAGGSQEAEDAAAAGDAAGDGAAGGDAGGHNGYTVLYKYNEGYTNAVKRPIKMAELLSLQQQQQ
jgi:chromosome transmission fidelity protein 18